MKNARRWRLPRLRCVTLLLAATVLLLAACGGPQQRPEGLDVSSYPDEVQRSYSVFAVRCSRCHSLARPLNASIDDVGYWDDYVRRMRRQPGSGISRRDATIILRFLYYYTQHRHAESALGSARLSSRERSEPRVGWAPDRHARAGPGTHRPERPEGCARLPDTSLRGAIQ